MSEKIKLKFLFCILLCWAILGCTFTARDNSPVASSSRAIEVILAECAVCHSTKEAQRGPILHGMDAWYLLAQIEKFHGGARGQDSANRSEYLMGVAVKKIRSEHEMKALAEWFANQKPMPAIRTVRGDLETGKHLYAARCASCHGDHAEGKRETASPSLTELEGWYFIDQMRKFRNGMRGKRPSDVGGQAMAAAVADFSPQQLKDVVAYVVDAFGLPEAPSLRKKLKGGALESNASEK